MNQTELIQEQDTTECENCGGEVVFELISYDDAEFDKLLCAICTISEALRKLTSPK